MKIYDLFNWSLKHNNPKISPIPIPKQVITSRHSQQNSYYPFSVRDGATSLAKQLILYLQDITNADNTAKRRIARSFIKSASRLQKLAYISISQTFVCEILINAAVVCLRWAHKLLHHPGNSMWIPCLYLKGDLCAKSAF